ncbi:MAG: polymerase sigma-70 factor, subfamily [Chloroflexota bacterium]|nr:polymerase sigma-70 factor, subfamily [Chloroflexota bacterium]
MRSGLRDSRAKGVSRIGGVHESTVSVAPAFGELEEHRAELTSYCYRMLGSPFDAEDAVQDTFVRAWRSRDRFEGRSAMRSWLYRIATNVCLDTLKSRQRRFRPMDIGPATEPLESNLNVRASIEWIEPIPQQLIAPDSDPADLAVERESIRLAFVAALQHLPPRQRAVLVLREVLRWEASEVAELLDTTVASVNSSLQRARATLAQSNISTSDPLPRLNDADRAMLERYVAAFERYDISALTSLIREDATQSMPPYDMWLSGREDVLAWWLGPGIGCRGSRVIPAISANGMPTYGQYKPSPLGGYEPWALQVLELSGGRIAEFTFFLDTARLFPLFGLPPRLDE